jgi:hypothetical protein
MARSRRTIGVAAGAVVLLSVVAFAGWWFLLRDDAPPEADIETAGETLDEAATSGTGDASSDGSTEGAGVDGTWTVDQSVGSFADFTST